MKTSKEFRDIVRSELPRRDIVTIKLKYLTELLDDADRAERLEALLREVGNFLAESSDGVLCAEACSANEPACKQCGVCLSRIFAERINKELTK